MHKDIKISTQKYGGLKISQYGCELLTFKRISAIFDVGREEIIEAMNGALLVGDSIVISHLRHAVDTLELLGCLMLVYFEDTVRQCLKRKEP